MTREQIVRYQAESVARAYMPTVKRHSKPVKTTQQKQTAGAAA